MSTSPRFPLAIRPQRIQRALATFFLLLFAAAPDILADPPAATMSAVEAFRAYSADVRAFNTRYYAKRVILTGIVKEVLAGGADDGGVTLVYLVGGPGPKDAVACNFIKEARAAARALKPGQSTTLEGSWAETADDAAAGCPDMILCTIIQGK